VTEESLITTVIESEEISELQEHLRATKRTVEDNDENDKYDESSAVFEEKDATENITTTNCPSTSSSINLG
jgi:hypothetical protein